MGIFNTITEYIHSRTREQWETLFFEQLENLKKFLRSHGEIAAIAGFLIGIICVLAFKLVFAVVLVAAVATFVIWNVSSPSNPHS